ncbi:transcriptional activator DEMETER-like isoform X3 [Arachis ipaensis]|uniref:DNA glycosylase/AP lyase ROS1-like n=1 Tax=Arachis hypogaea TaxID=3818 RepID=UPI000A2B1352|nr:transcriptional activator DEMETER-like isoform X3 [Arachis ipaensis]XP_025674065.1 transcriptional activator DEMETER-like [Arachis hypogaea]QHN95157.1 hypothetical protein DS421_18g607120 [Arachis hypogaea]
MSEDTNQPQPKNMEMEAGIQFPWIPETPVKPSPNRQRISNRDDDSTSADKLDFDILNIGDEDDASAAAANNQVPNAPSQCDDGYTSHDELKTLNPPASKKRRGDNKKKGSNNNGQHTKVRKKIYRPRILIDESLNTKKVGKKSQPKAPKTPKKKKTPSRTPKPSTPSRKRNQSKRAPSCKLLLLPLLNDEGRASLPFLGNNVNKFDQEYFDFESSICKNALGSQYNLLETYQKLASFSSSCLMHSRQVGANFPSICRRKRMKRIRARLEKYLTPFKKGLRSKIFIRKKKSCLEKFTIEGLTTTKKEMKSLIRRIRSLKRMKKSGKTKGKNGQLVVYKKGLGGDRMLVPYKEHDPNNKKLRVEVALDEETLRVWNLIMDGKTHEDSDDLKQQQWERERFAYKCKVGVFMVKMHELQGSREFSPWKGSVLDSVIGAYLTQNVSDHLSSSAYMSLAARFPIKSSTSSDLCIEDVPRVERLQFIESNAIFPGDKLTEELENIKIEEMGAHNVKEEPFKSKEEETRVKLLKEVDKETRERWDKLRKEYGKSKRHSDHDDSVDWEAVRCADVKEIAKAIAGRGQHNVIAERIKSLLNELHDSYGDLDLEWLRYAPPTEAKRCLLDIYGLGLKSVECIRLLTLQNKAFPVDVNVGRIAVRLGWVPLQPLPEETQIHNLEKYPLFDNIQKYLWPRLCHLLPKDLYQLHYHLITFGKVFCTKKNPNCDACPMSTNCEHFKSAFASAKSLPGTTSRQPSQDKMVTDNFLPMPIFKVNQSSTTTKYQEYRECEPIIEMPSSPEPEPERIYMLEFEANNEEEDYHSPDDEKILVMNLSSQSKKTHNHSTQEDKNHMNMSASLVTLPYAGSMPAPKMKNASRLRTERLVYVLNDGHPLLAERTPLEPGDPSPYSLVIWSADELERSDESIMNNLQEKDSLTVPGTLLIPCRTAMRGRFPLNGTYFQVNEVFADYDSMKNPIDVPRTWLWQLEKRIAYFGAGASSILKGLSADEIKDCFWKGYVCVRAIDAKTGAPRPLSYRFHRNTTVKAKTGNKTTQEKEVKTDIKTTQEKEG